MSLNNFEIIDGLHSKWPIVWFRANFDLESRGLPIVVGARIEFLKDNFNIELGNLSLLKQNYNNDPDFQRWLEKVRYDVRERFEAVGDRIFESENRYFAYADSKEIELVENFLRSVTLN